MYLRVLKLQHSWALLWWNFCLDDGTCPLKEYMNLRPPAEWRQMQDVMVQIDYNSSSGWRHQHSGRRVQWEDLFNRCWEEWREDLAKGAAYWRSVQALFIKSACSKSNIQCEGMIKDAGPRDASRPWGKGRKQKTRGQDLETSQWSRSAMLPGNLGVFCDGDLIWQKARTYELVTDNQALADALCGNTSPESESTLLIQVISDIFPA